MIASRISRSSRSAALTGGGRNPPPRLPRWWPPSWRVDKTRRVRRERTCVGERRGRGRRKASIERGLLSRRPVGSAGRSRRRDLAIDAVRHAAPSIRGVSAHAPRVCGVCRPCDRRPFRRGVTRRHRRRRRELMNARDESRLFPATTPARRAPEIERRALACATRPNALGPDSRARRARACASSHPHERMGLWKSLLVALGLAKKKVRVEAGAGARRPRSRPAPSSARSSEKKALERFFPRLHSDTHTPRTIRHTHSVVCSS